MNKKNINTELQYQIREYLEYYLKESLVNNNEEENQIMPKQAQIELILDIGKKI